MNYLTDNYIIIYLHPINQIIRCGKFIQIKIAYHFLKILIII